MTEADVRILLMQHLLARGLASAEVIYEFWVPRSNERADVALISSTLHAFEIKTERDTLKRLPRQVEAYGRLFDSCDAVVAIRHVERAIEILPHWWGVIVIPKGENVLIRKREASENMSVDPEALVRLLWRDEVYAALCSLGLPPDPSVGRSGMWTQLLSRIDLVHLKVIVREALLRRDPLRARFPVQRFAIS